MDSFASNAGCIALDACVAAGTLPADRADTMKMQLLSLLKELPDAQQASQAGVGHVKHLADLIRSEKGSLEKVRLKTVELERSSNLASEERARLQSTLRESEAAEAAAQLELNECKREEKELARRVSDAADENRAQVEPALDELIRSIADVRAEIARSIELKAGQETSRGHVKARMAQLTRQVARLHSEGDDARGEAASLRVEPQRLHKQLESVQSVRASADSEIVQLRAALSKQEDDLREHAQTLYESKKVRRKLDVKLRTQREVVATALAQVDDAEAAVSDAAATHKRLLEQRIERRAELELVMVALRSGIARKDAASASYGRALRELQRREGQIHDIVAQIPSLELANENKRIELHSINRETAGQLDDELVEVRKDADALRLRLDREEGVGKQQHEALGFARDDVANLEAQRDAWQREESIAIKHMSALRAQRDMRSREAEKMIQARRAVQEQSRTKELALIDVSKKLTDLGVALKELTRLYEVVTTEKNGYAAAIQAASQSAGEMRERIKILANEVEILSNESVAKDKALGKEQQAHALSKSQRDLLRIEVNKIAALYKEKQATVESHIQIIDKLNSIITGLERDMVALRRRYEAAIEGRNYAGVQLIDRNDELVILYEKANIHNHTLVEGERQLGVVNDEIRTLQLEEADLERQLRLAQRRLPETPALAERILDLQIELARKRAQTEKLCQELEATANARRWSQLEGEDPDAESLQQRVALLERRLENARTEALDRDVLYEELTQAVHLARAQLQSAQRVAHFLDDDGSNLAAAAHSVPDDAADTATLHTGMSGEQLSNPTSLLLLRQAGQLQAQLHHASRKISSLVAELSMYQAMELKLSEDTDSAMDGLRRAQAALERGEPPTRAAEVKWRSLQRTRLPTRRPSGSNGPAPLHSLPGPGPSCRPSMGAHATRPDSYIPEGDALPVPKPFSGTLAPFQPSALNGAHRYYNPLAAVGSGSCGGTTRARDNDQSDDGTCSEDDPRV